MRGERREAARHGPDVQVVHLDDVGILGERPRDRAGSMPAGAASMKIRPDSRSSVQLERTQSAATSRPAIGSKRSQPVDEHERTRDRGADERREIGRDVEERTAHVQALAVGAGEHERRGEVDGDADERDDEDDAAVDVGRSISRRTAPYTIQIADEQRA